MALNSRSMSLAISLLTDVLRVLCGMMRWSLRDWLSRGLFLAAPLPGTMSMYTRPSERTTLEIRSICSWMGLLLFIQACVGYQPAGAPQVLCDGYDRGPGSFCALNPEACPPQQNPSERQQPEELDAVAGKSACLDACEAGGEVLENFCRRLKTPRRKALCWAATKGTKTACIGMCHAIYQ